MLCRGVKMIRAWLENNDWRLKAEALIKQHEGLRLKPYKDTLGFITVGYGRCLDKKPLTIAEAEHLFQNDLTDCVKECKQNFKFFDKLNPARRAVIVDMCFNLGINKLKDFKNTLKYIEQGQYTEAADNMLKSLWAQQVKDRAITLSNMMRTGEFPK